MIYKGYTIKQGYENGKQVFYAITDDTALIFIDMVELKAFCDKIPIDDEILKTL